MAVGKSFMTFAVYPNPIDMSGTKRSNLTLVVAAVISALMLMQGCTSNPFAPAAKQTPPLDISAIDSTMQAAKGDNLTFMVLVKNNQKSTHTVSFTIPSLPAGWRAALNNDSLDIVSKGTKAFFLTVTISADASPGSYKVKVRASSTTKSEVTSSKELSVKVLSGAGDIASGENIRVDYVGYLEDYTVFDTSLRTVGTNANIPKSSDFTVRPEYSQLAFTVGAGQMIKGFDKAVMGMRLYQSKTVRVEPKDGYGVFESVKINLSEEFPMYRTVTKNDFTFTYGEQAALNKYVREPYWNWKVQVMDINDDNVTILTLPELNQVSTPYGWDTKVIDVNGSLNGGIGRIQVRHYPTAGVNVTYKAFKAEITSLSSSQAEITYNTNSQNALAVRTITFHLKITST
jgi:FKBP-type peptidyl-prolyl cis-trans isomerase 2